MTHLVCIGLVVVAVTGGVPSQVRARHAGGSLQRAPRAGGVVPWPGEGACRAWHRLSLHRHAEHDRLARPRALCSAS